MGKTQATCATATPLTFDGVCRTFAAAGGSSNTVLCNHNNANNTTWFSFTTGNPVVCPRIKITAGVGFEIGIFKAGCSNNAASTINSMCVEDGDAIWSPDVYDPLTPNTTYYLRIRTKGNYLGNIEICAAPNTQLNDNCQTALQIGTNYVWDDNGCNTPGPGITPAQSCATTLENTAWYVLTVDQAGPVIINIKNIDCDNWWMGSDGYQIGFFTGSCGALQYLHCNSGQATGTGFVQYTTQSLPAGANVYVTIDGSSGSNCSYEISGINVLNVLSLQIQPRNRPVTDPLFTISGRTITAKTDFELYNTIGQLVDKRSSGSYSYSSGLYVLRIKNKSHFIFLR